MKTVVALAVVFLGVSSRAHAAPSYVMRYVIEPGYTPDPIRFTLELKSDGSLSTERAVLTTHQVERHALGSLAADTVSALRRAAEGLRREALHDMEPGQPRCADLPEHKVSVVHADGEEVVIWRDADCHHYVMQGSAEAAVIKNLLVGLAGAAKLR